MARVVSCFCAFVWFYVRNEEILVIFELKAIILTHYTVLCHVRTTATEDPMEHQGAAATKLTKTKESPPLVSIAEHRSCAFFQFLLRQFYKAVVSVSEGVSW